MKFKSEVQLEALNNATVDTDRFLVSDSSTVKYRTGAQVLSDIGGQAALTNPITGTGTTNYVSKFTGATTLGNSLLYDNGTNVGIGTTSPTAAKLVLNSGTTNQNALINGDKIGFTRTSDAAEVVYFKKDISLGTEGTANINGYDGIQFRTQGAESVKAVITSAGNLGIGTTSPATKLEVSGIASFTGSGGRSVVIEGQGAGRIDINGDGSAYAVGIKFNSSPGGTALSGIWNYGSGTSQQWLAIGGTAYNNAAMYALPSGNVGIGTSSPNYRTQIETTGADVFLTKNTSSTSFNRSYFYNNNNVGIQFLNFGSAYGFGTEFGVGQNGSVIQSNTTSAFAVGTSGAYPLLLGTSGTERMRITSAGNVGIGTTSPSQKLDVNGKIKSNSSIFVDSIGSDSVGVGANFTVSRASDAKQWIMQLNASAGLDFWNYNGSAFNRRLTINESGNVGIGTTSPAYQLDVASSGRFAGLLISNDRLWLNGNTVISNWISSGLSAGYSQINSYGWINGAGNLILGTNGSERMRIDSSGNVGIGTTSPSVASGLGLVLNGQAGQTRLAFKNNYTGDTSSDGVQFALIGGTSAFVFQNRESDGYFSFETNGNEIFRTSGTNVGIGTTSPNNKLDVNGNINVPSTNFYRYDGDTGLIGSATTIVGGSSNQLGIRASNDILFATNGANERMRIASNGNVGIGTTSPSSKLQINASSWALSTANVSRMLQKSVGIAGDYEQHVILLHPIYNGSLINYNKCSGTIYASRGGTSSGLINDTYYLDTASAYNSYNGTINSVIGNGKLYTCDYNGVKYVALLPDYRTSAVQYDFDGYVKSTGEELKLVVYRLSNSGTVTNSEVYNSLAIFSPGTTYYQGDVCVASNVGIGTTSPAAKLDVNGTGIFRDRLTISADAGNEQFVIQRASNTNSQLILGYHSDGYGRIQAVQQGSGYTPLVLQKDGGNVGIGTTSPSKKLDVNGDALINNVTIGRGPGNISTNTAVGTGALDSTTTANYNIALGWAANVNNNANGLTAIGVDLNVGPDTGNLGPDCLAISQFNSNADSAQVPHIYAPKPVPIPNGGATNVITFDLLHYAGAIIEYMIRLDDGGDYAVGTVYTGWKSSGSGNLKDVRQIEWSNMSGFVFSLGGAGQTLVLTNTSGNDAWIRITVRGMMTN